MACTRLPTADSTDVGAADGLFAVSLWLDGKAVFDSESTDVGAVDGLFVASPWHGGAAVVDGACAFPESVSQEVLGSLLSRSSRSACALRAA